MGKLETLIATGLSSLSVILIAGQQPGQLSRQNETAIEARSFGEYNELMTIPDLLAYSDNRNKRSIVVRRSLPDEEGGGHAYRKTEDAELDRLALNSDTVVLGRIIGLE